MYVYSILPIYINVCIYYIYIYINTHIHTLYVYTYIHIYIYIYIYIHIYTHVCNHVCAHTHVCARDRAPVLLPGEDRQSLRGGIISSFFLTQRVFPTSSWCLLRRWTGDPPETLSGLTSNPLSSPRRDNIMAHVYI